MGLEAATFISQLVATNPVGATDPRSQGDDHLRLIKAALLATFPAITGAVTAIHTELNQLHGGAITSLGVGSAAAPSYSFSGDTDTGIRRGAANDMRFTCGAADVMQLLQTQIFSLVNHYFSDGVAATPGISFGGDSDSGFYRVAGNDFRAVAGGNDSARFGFSTTAFAQFADGSITQPGIGFISDSDTGIIRNSANILTLVAGGAQRLQVSSTYVYSVGVPLWLEDGSAANPVLSFVNDQDSGIWRAGANQIQMVVGGQTCAQFYLNGIIPQALFADGAAGAPSMGFNNDLDTGAFRSAADTYDISCGGVSIATFDNVTAGVGQIRFRRQLYLDINSANSATAGAATALPANPVGYLAITLNGTQRRIPYYGN